MIARTDLDAARRVLSSKVDGMRTLAPLLSRRQLDFVALCSSTAGLLGEAGQVAYCAANAVLDAWAHHLRRDHVAAVSIDWSVWREVGMAVETDVPKDLKAWRTRTLANGITPSEGGAVLRLALAAGLHQAVIAPDAARSVADLGPGAVLSADASCIAATRGRFARPDLPHACTPPANDIQRALVAIWEELLGIAPIGVDDDFFTLGGHSLLATRVLAAIWRDFTVAISLAEFFEHATITRLADEIVLGQIAAYDSNAVEAAMAEVKAEE
jgi:phthiocerol/phenolphthiocerol synthesis type-I polyketide synthase E